MEYTWVWGGGQSPQALQHSPQPVPNQVLSHVFILVSLPSRGQPEAEGGHPKEHRDGPGSGDAQPDTAPGQP